MATTNLDFRKIDYDQLLDKPITRTSANVDTIKTAGVYDRGDGKRFLVSVDGNTITQIEESYNGYRTRTSTDGGLVRGAWTTTEFSDASAKRDVVVISDTEPVEKKETTAWIDTSDENKFKVYDGTDWMVISGQSIQTEEMPTASEELEGKIIQYEGATTSTFTHGYFYECVGDGQNPETFSRINVQTQDSVEYTAGEGIEIINGTRVDYSAMRGPCDEGFHVPTKEEWESFVNNIVDDARTIHLPRSGQYNGDGSFSGFGGPYGSYWTSSTNSQNAIYLDIGFDYWLSINEDWAIERVNALPIRAFKDEPVIPDNTWIEVVTGKVWHNTGLGLISILVDTDTYVTIQDKNVGATEVWNSNEAVTSTNCGKFFQWGNNYGFEYGATLDTSSTKVDASTYGPSEYSSNTFITGDSDWSSVQNDDLWGGVTGPQTTTINNAITNIGVLSINGQTGHVAIDTGSQAEVMPTPSVENVGKIIQYTGDTNEYYTHAHFYEIIEDPNHPGVYIYQEVETQSVSADSVSYDNTDSGLTATNIQEAIDEIAPETIEVDDYSAVQGPCEDGFHIPSGAEFDNLLTITNAFNYDDSDYISKLHFPLSGHWSADHTLSTSFTRYYKDQRAYLFTINNIVDGNNLETYKLLIDGRTNSVSCPLGPLDSSLSQIRAFKNEYVEPDSTWTVETGALGGAGVFHNATLGLISITNGTDKFITIKDKNEGATTVYNSGDTMSESNAGKFFQWGNNYGFPFDMDGFDNYTQTQVNTTSYAPSTYSSNACFAHGYDIWMEPNNQNLWGGITGVQHITIKGYDSQNIVYNNSTSIFNSTNVQDVIDEISEKIESGSLGVTSYDDLTDTPTIKTQEQWYSWTTGGGIFYTKTLDVELTTPLYGEDTSTGDTHALKSNWHFTTIDKPNDYYEVDLDELGAGAAFPGTTPEPGDTVINVAPGYEHTFSIDGMTDTNITNVSNGQIMKYDSVSGKWINSNSEGGSLSKDYTLSSSDGADLKITLPSKNAMYTLTINTDSPTEYNCIVSTTNYSSMGEMGIEIEGLSNSSVKAYYTISSSGNVLYLTNLYASSFDSMSGTISLISNSVTQTEFENIEIVMFDESDLPSDAVEIDLNPSEGAEVAYLTQAQYDVLPAADKADPTKHYVVYEEGVIPTPGGGIAEDTSYDNTNSGLTATNVQDAIDEVNSNTSNDINNLTNKVNYLEINGGFFPLIADNIIYSGSSFSYTATEDTLLYISDAADTYLKIDGGNIAGQYTPGYIHVIEGQTITYSRNCKVYKANSTLVIDDTDVTLGLMDNQYLGPVNYQDNQVASINSAHLGNNKVATATGTGDLTFHFEHEFNTQHSKMDEAELVVSGNLTYGNMGTIESVATFNDSFEKITTIDINVARNGYYTYNGNKYAIKVNTFDWSGSTTTYDIDLLQLNDNLEIVNTTNIHNSISGKYTGGSTSVCGKYIVVRDQSYSPSMCTAFKINDSLNGIIQTNEADGLLYSNRPTYPATYNHFIYNNCIYSYGYNDYDSEYGCAPIITKQDTNGDLTVVRSFSMGYYQFSGSNGFIGIDTNNNDMYVMVTGRRSPYTKVYRKIDLNTLSQTSIDGTIFDQTSLKGLIGLLTIEGGKAIVHTYYNGSLINDKKIQNKNSSTDAITIYQMFINNTITYTAENVLFPTNILKVNNNNALVSPIIGYSSSDSVSKILFGGASFTSTDTVDIDITIKNNSGESRTVTLPKSGWSTSGDKTIGTGTTFTFNS